MDTAERDGHLRYFRSNHLPLLVVAMANQMDTLRSDIGEFKRVTSQIALMALSCLYRERGIKDVYADQELWDKLIFLLVGAFNSVLSTDYPFVFAIAKQTDPVRCEVRAMQRGDIPGWRDWVSRACVPVFCVERKEDAINPEKLRYEKTFLPDGKGGFIDPDQDTEGLEPKKE